MRTIISLADPITSADSNVVYASLEDRKEEQTEIVQEFSLEVKEYAHEEEILVNIIPYSNVLEQLSFRETLNSDVAYAIFSVLFVLIYIWIHLSSLCMAVTSMILILLSFPITYFIYTGLL